MSTNFEELVKLITLAARNEPAVDTDPASKSNVQDGDESATESAPDVDQKAQKEREAFASNTDDLHEFMQRFRMDSLQAQIDNLRSGIRDKDAVAKGKEIDNELRLKMADFTFKFMVCWCFFVAVMFIVYVVCSDGKPPSEVMIALLGTSTLSIIGLVGFVVSGLFKSRSEEKKPE